ncbi:MAG TPA: hypothetical protein VK845_16055 [Gemmatimonadales bacterium]|nr:hypothetical protein [Gemmatimonadales bacterium]
MGRRVAALVGAWVCLSALYLAGFYFFGSLFSGEAQVAPPLVPFFVGFALSNALLVLFFDWLVKEMNHPVKAGLAIAISQLLLVNVTYVLTGSRTPVAGAASSAVLLVTWPLVAIVYSKIRGPTRPGRS